MLKVDTYLWSKNCDFSQFSIDVVNPQNICNISTRKINIPWFHIDVPTEMVTHVDAAALVMVSMLKQSDRD